MAFAKDTKLSAAVNKGKTHWVFIQKSKNTSHRGEKGAALSSLPDLIYTDSTFKQLIFLRTSLHLSNNYSSTSFLQQNDTVKACIRKN